MHYGAVPISTMTTEIRKSLLATARKQHGLLTTSQFHKAGCPRGALRTMVSQGEIERVRHGVYRLEGSPRTFSQRALAAVIGYEQPVAVGGTAAALLWGWQVTQPSVITLLSNRRLLVGAGQDDVVVRVTSMLGAGDITRVENVPVTGLARTLGDLAVEVEPADYHRLVDSCLSRRRPSLGALDSHLSRMQRRRQAGARFLHDVLIPWRGCPKMQSVAESAMLRAVIAAGLPWPVEQLEHVLPDGTSIHTDFAWPEARVVLEVDGFEFHGDPESFARDRRRDLELGSLGWKIVRVPAASALANPVRWIGALERAIAGA